MYEDDYDEDGNYTPKEAWLIEFYGGPTGRPMEKVITGTYAHAMAWAKMFVKQGDFYITEY